MGTFISIFLGAIFSGKEEFPEWFIGGFFFDLGFLAAGLLTIFYPEFFN